MSFFAVLSEFFLTFFGTGAEKEKGFNGKFYISLILLIATIIVLTLHTSWFMPPRPAGLPIFVCALSVIITAVVFLLLNKAGIVYHLRPVPALIYFLTSVSALSTFLLYCNHILQWW